MRRLMLVSLVALLLAGLSISQQEPAKLEVTPTIRAESRMVVVDAIVTDGSGKPVTDLKPEEVVVEENGKQEKIAGMELVTPSTEGPQTLPETIYSNRPEFNAPHSGYTILLIDALNTRFENQAYARRELLRYVDSQLQPGHRVAVYALGNSLYRLQGFTDDPELLKAAIMQTQHVQLETKTLSQPPPPASGSGSVTSIRGNTPNPALQGLAGRLSAFESEQTLFNAEVTISTTTAALRALSRMMAGVPGRKNLVWITGGVPIALRLEDMTVNPMNTAEHVGTDPGTSGFAQLQQEMTYEAHSQNVKFAAANDVMEMASLLQQAQISVYVVDARGLFIAGSQYITASQANMKSITGETGGRYYINRNDIDVAVAAASRDGGTYYSIAYYPDKKKFDGSFRKIKISIKRPGMNVRHRAGYYAVDFSKKSAKERAGELEAAVRATAFAPSTMVLFDVQIVPPPAAAQAKVPVTFLVRPGNFTGEDANGGKHVNMDFFVTAVAPDGKGAASRGMTVDKQFTNEQFQQLSSKGMLLGMDVTLPPGNYGLLLAVRDNHTGMVGTLNVPLQLQAPAP